MPTHENAPKISRDKFNERAKAFVDLTLTTLRNNPVTRMQYDYTEERIELIREELHRNFHDYMSRHFTIEQPQPAS